MPFYNPQAETLSRDELTSLQDARLKTVIRHVCERSGFFRRKLAAAGVDPRGFRGLEDLHQLPFMGKDDFRAEYPLGMSCVDKRDIVEMHMSSGSTGTPVVMPYTEADLAQWAECMARCYAMAGATRGDVCQITPGFGLFNGGFGCYHGARAAGLFVLPCGAGNTARLYRAVERCKIALSDAPHHHDALDFIEPGLAVATDTAQLAQAASSYLDELRTLLHQVRADIGHDPDVVFLTGGMSRAGYIRQTAADAFPGARLVQGDPSFGVVQGLALAGQP